MSDNPAGWQPDPTGKHEHRYWDGTQWTDNVADGGVAGTEPYEPVASETPPPSAEPDPTTPEAPTVVTPVPGDDTTSYPTASGAPPPFAPPPPYVPPTPVATGGGDDDGNKRRLIIGGAILALVALAVIALIALGGDDDESVRTELASAIEGDTSMSGEQAQCVADLLIDEAGEDAFKDTNFDAEDPPPEFIAAAVAVGAQTFADECGVDEAAFGGTDSGDDGDADDGGDGGEQTVEDLENACADGDFGACDDLYFAAQLGSELEDFGSTCGGIADPQLGECEATNGGQDASTTDGVTDDDVDDILTDAYKGMGLTEEQAECLTEQILDAMESGELSEEQAMTEVFSYLADCDISMEDLNGN